MTAPEFSFVVPILNERDTLPELCRRLAAVIMFTDGVTTRDETLAQVGEYAATLRKAME